MQKSTVQSTEKKLAARFRAEPPPRKTISVFGTQETCLSYILVIFVQTKVIIKRQNTVLSAQLRYFKTCRPLS